MLGVIQVTTLYYDNLFLMIISTHNNLCLPPSADAISWLSTVVSVFNSSVIRSNPNHTLSRSILMGERRSVINPPRRYAMPNELAHVTFQILKPIRGEYHN